MPAGGPAPGAADGPSAGQSWTGTRPTLADPPPPARGRTAALTTARRRPWIPAAAGAAAVVVLGAGAFLFLSGSDGPPSKTVFNYGDDFSDNNSGWSGSTWISGSGYWQGGYRIDAGSSIYQRRAEAAPSKKEPPARELVGVDVSVLGGPSYGMAGVFCRATGESDDAAYYEFLVRADGQGTLIRKTAGKAGSRELVRKSSAAGFKKNAKNRLQAACEQDGKNVRLRLWLNGTLAAETTDADGPLANGQTGLVAVQENGGSGGDVRVLFDNVDISSIE
jgi:hypothetical protein